MAAIITLQGGCERKEPVSAPTPQATAPTTPVSPAEGPQATAPATPVPPGETFVLSNVRFHHDGSGLVASYDVRNRGAERERAYLCVDLIDKDGYFVRQGFWFARLSLRAGDSDQVTDDRDYLSPETWKATEVLRFYMSEQHCTLKSGELRSASLFFDKFGQPLPPGTQPEGKTSEVEAGEVTSPWFRLEGVRVFQSNQDEVMLEYKVTNLTQGRASGRVCVRLTNDSRCSCEGLDEAESEEFNLGFAASDRHLVQLSLKDDQNWDKGRQLVIYTAQFGCSDSPERATSKVLTLAKPRSIHAPVRPELEGEGWTPEQLEEASREAAEQMERLDQERSGESE